MFCALYIQRSKGEWTFYLYDVLGRLTVQGTCKNTNVESAEYGIVECTRANSATGLANSGYSSSFALNSPVVHLVNYYDDYNFRTLTGFNNSNFPAGTINAKGLLTGSVITVLDSNAKLYSANYYDKKGRMIKGVSSNLMGGYETTNTVFTFTGKPATVTHVHTATGNQSLTEMYTYKYDHAERLSKVEHTLNGNKVTLTDNTYNDLSRLETKSLHNSFADIMGYKYNIRGWLTNIDSNNFILKLNYGYPASGGNIASIFWKSGEEGRQKYTFTYDGLGRMLNADHLILGLQDEDDDDWGVTTGLMNAQMGRQIEEFPLARENAFTERVTEYDKNGNILKLVRYGQTGANSYGVIDNLTMTLTGNQLNRVDDASTASAYGGGFEFKDAVKQNNEYAYDANGNLTQDLNKGIEDIQYNCLNLPRLVKFKDQSTITYTYAADGTKLRVEHKIGSSTTQTTYCSNVIYEDGTAKCLLTEEGYVSLDDREYHYYLKDHQGNNRVLVNKNGGVEEINHYYPFGGVFASEENVQPYKYNGKELDAKKGLNWYDYGARHYDATLGRWHAVDPLAEKYYSVSPYNYCMNNPMNAIDPDGKLPVFLIPLVKGAVGAIVDAAAQVTISMANGQGFGEAMSNIDYTSVGASFLTSALTMPGMSSAAKTATVTAIVFDAAIDISSSKGIKTVVTGEKAIINAAIDISSSILPGKVIDGITSGFNKAVASDLSATSAATMTKGTKSGLKQIQSIVNSTSFQTGVNAVGSFVSGLVGGQANTSVSNSGENPKPALTNRLVNQSVQPADAINIQKPLYPFIIQQ